MRPMFLIGLLLCAGSACAQFDLQSSGTSASLRGIDAPTSSVAWASGSNGTILRTINGGATWQTCTPPVGGETLDFRGIRALDATNAAVMSSGKGSLSRIYRTLDGCQTWALVLTDPDPNGFFDTMNHGPNLEVDVLSDPIQGKFAIYTSLDGGSSWATNPLPGLDANSGDAAFAASNSSLITVGSTLVFGTGGTNLPHIYINQPACPLAAAFDANGKPLPPPDPSTCPQAWFKTDVLLASQSSAAGIFSLATRADSPANVVAVGGNYLNPTVSDGTGAFSVDAGKTWNLSMTSPNGYRSAVAFDPTSQTWIAVGTSGSDFSTDGGATWQPMVASPTDTSDIAANWNAISPPFLVGTNGRIGHLRAPAATASTAIADPAASASPDSSATSAAAPASQF